MFPDQNCLNKSWKDADQHAGSLDVLAPVVAEVVS